MIDSTAHIDPHWPADVAAFAQEQPPLLDVGPSPAPEPVPFAGLTISKSEIAVLRRCPRRYFFEYVLNRTPAAGSGIAAEWGTALHRGLERLYLDTKEAAEHGKTLPEVLTPNLMAWRAASAALEPGTDADGRPYTPPADPYARAALRAMLRAYAAVWEPDDAERYEVLAVELPFDLPVLTAEGRVSRGRREGARREGRIDAMVRERAEQTGDPVDAGEMFDAGPGLPGPFWIVEHKSTGKAPDDERWYVGIELELQPSLYFDAARELGHEPAGVLYDVVRRPDFDDPKPPPQRNKDGSERKAPSEVCSACGGSGGRSGDSEAPDSQTKCLACSGTGRVSKQVAYTNPRHGEPAAIYEERVYQLAITRPADFFHRRALTIEPWQIEESRRMVHAAALEIGWRTREDLWPQAGDRYVCGARGMVCPWIDVCGRREAVTNDRLFPLKRKKD